jgi:hypothetical protein
VGLGLDWDAPWLQPYRDTGSRLQENLARGMDLHDALNAEPGAPVRFVAHDLLPPASAYEAYIFETGRCPTRPGLHDFFNGLCWLRLPLAKARLNALQAEAIAAAPAGAPRGPLRDAITVFDENGALLDAPGPLWEALRELDWQRLFVGLRPMWSEARVLVFGHALLEKLVTPRKALTAHVWHTACPLQDLGEADAWLAHQFRAERLAAKPFAPLPLLGIPGWWPGNENFSFYDDSEVFRGRRARSQPAGKSRLLLPDAPRP